MASIRRKPSGRWEARYRDPSGRQRGRSFGTKLEARRFLERVGADMQRGAWVDPRGGRLTFRRYAERWLSQRTDLEERTGDLYGDLLRLHIVPTFGEVKLARITTAAVRPWYLDLRGRHPWTAEKAYRLLRAVLNTAVADELIVKNPCTIKGAGGEHPVERPVASVAEVQALAEALPDRLRLWALLAAWCGLRFGELRALRRADVDQLRGTVRVRVSMQDRRGGGRREKAPKSEAGSRTIHYPPHLADAVAHHLARFTGHDPDDLVFTGMKDGPVSKPVWHTAWTRARQKTGMLELRLHDLRHAGNTWAAATGASTKELMARMGHSSPAAALRYQHATADRDAVIAAALSDLVKPAPVVGLRPDQHAG